MDFPISLSIRLICLSTLGMLGVLFSFMNSNFEQKILQIYDKDTVQMPLNALFAYVSKMKRIFLFSYLIALNKNQMFDIVCHICFRNDCPSSLRERLRTHKVFT